jgi:hypothetical protein
MDFIMNNKQTILNWYNKQKDLPIPPSIDDVDYNKVTKTKWVKDLYIKMYEIDFNELSIENIQKIKVYPLLRRNLCHTNCYKMLTILNKNSEKYQHILGYTFTSCPCGMFQGFELHSVLKHIESGEYIDLTTDWAKEDEKYFIPLFINKTANEINYLINNCNLEFFYTHEKHICKNVAGNPLWLPEKKYCTDLKTFILKLSLFNDIKFW